MSTKYKKLILSLILDAIGLIPIPFFDVVWAPASAYIMTKMYKSKEGKIAGILSFVEEIIPFSDILPTFTIMWVYSYIINKEKVDTIVEA
ncbi:hypothetical protein [uncultured Polaribacter sp.]|uniref:hypothetical protein n=1 Tax=uncultured Polaribacter sp. TaxID=174711 RepID=UPI002611A2A0|nr:hypothetical protein [uncultured Polaribacter sp.]